MKKGMVFVLCALLVVMSLFAQGSTDNAADKTLTVWSMLTQPERAAELENLAAEFESLHPGVDIEISLMPWTGALDKLVAAVMAGNPPDLTVVGQGMPQTLAETGGLVELSDLVEEIGGKEQFLGTTLSISASTLDGSIYALPLYITPVVAYYRQSYLDEAGFDKIPETWEEYYEMCKAVTDPENNRYGFGIPLGDQHGMKMIWSAFQANGVDLVNVDEDGNWYVDIDDEDYAALVEAYEWLYALIRDCAPEGTISYTQANLRELVATGVVMSRIDTPEIYYNVRSMDPDNIDDVRYFRLPGRKTNNQYMGWNGFAIPAAGNVELAKEFLKFCYTDDRLVDFYLSYPYCMFPVVESIYSNEHYLGSMPEELKPLVPDMVLDIFRNSNPIALSNGPFPYAGEVDQKNMFGIPLALMFTDGITAEEAVDMLIENLHELIGD